MKGSDAVSSTQGSSEATVHLKCMENGLTAGVHTTGHVAVNNVGTDGTSGFVQSALLLAIVACAVMSFEAMPCLCCFLHVTQAVCIYTGKPKRRFCGVHDVGVEILNHCIKAPKTGRDSNT